MPCNRINLELGFHLWGALDWKWVHRAFWSEYKIKRSLTPQVSAMHAYTYMYSFPKWLEIHSHFILILKYSLCCFTCILSFCLLSCHYFNVKIQFKTLPWNQITLKKAMCQKALKKINKIPYKHFKVFSSKDVLPEPVLCVGSDVQGLSGDSNRDGHGWERGYCTLSPAQVVF